MRWIDLLLGSGLTVFVVRRFIAMVRTGRLELNGRFWQWNDGTAQRAFFLLALAVHLIFLWWGIMVASRFFRG